MRKNKTFNEEAILYTCNVYEKKLKELMGEEAFIQFSLEVAKDMFFNSIKDIEDFNFRNFCLDNFDLITGVADNSKLDFPNSEGGLNL